MKTWNIFFILLSFSPCLGGLVERMNSQREFWPPSHPCHLKKLWESSSFLHSPSLSYSFWKAGVLASNGVLDVRGEAKRSSEPSMLQRSLGRFSSSLGGCRAWCMGSIWSLLEYEFWSMLYVNTQVVFGVCVNVGSKSSQNQNEIHALKTIVVCTYLYSCSLLFISTC